MTALKWTITTQERNALVETHLGCIWWTINKNRRLISAAGLDDEDVFQQLAIRMIRAVENYDPDKGKDLEQHIFAQLQYEVLNCKDAAKLYGIKGAPYGARDLTVSLDALVETGVQFCGGGGLERRIVEDGYSPAAVLGEIKVKGIQFNTTICEATLYSYIKKGVFLTLEMVHLPCKGKQKRPYTKVKKNKKAARASAGKSIEKRDPEIDTREEVGHWEMDCVEGKKKTKETLLVLSERKARKEIMIKMKDQTAGSVVAALDRLERRYGTLFYKIFQTITVDNGSEFADVEGLERSCRRKGKRTTVFYCHPYSSYERGTNENINRMIRRWFPKGTDFGQVPKKAIQAVEDWLNAYPREILGFRSADEVFAEGLAALG